MRSFFGDSVIFTVGSVMQSIVGGGTGERFLFDDSLLIVAFRHLDTSQHLFSNNAVVMDGPQTDLNSLWTLEKHSCICLIFFFSGNAV